MKLRIFSLAIVILLLAAPAALAASPHFVSVSASIADSGALEVKFKEAGLGANLNIQYYLRAGTTATWVCSDNSVPPTTVFAAPIEKWATFSSGKNGSVSATMSVGPVAPGALWGCPKNKQVLKYVSYGTGTRNIPIGLADRTNALIVTLPNIERLF
jgi:hypothetical protein